VQTRRGESEHTSKALRYGTRSQGRVHPPTVPAFSFQAEAGTHLPTPEGRKAELALDLRRRPTNCGWPSPRMGRQCQCSQKRRA